MSATGAVRGSFFRYLQGSCGSQYGPALGPPMPMFCAGQQTSRGSTAMRCDGWLLVRWGIERAKRPAPTERERRMDTMIARLEMT